MTLKDPIEKRRLWQLNLSLLLVFAALIGGGYAFAGVDFAKATLVGCVVVAINFFLSQRVVGRLIVERQLRAGLVLSYIFKFALSVVILFFAVTRWKMDLVGVMVGLSSIFISVVLSTLFRREPEKSDAGES